MTTLQKYQKAQQLIANGTPVLVAIKRVKMSPVSYYKLKREHSTESESPTVTIHEAPKNRGPKARGSKKALSTTTENVLVVVVPPSRLKEVLGAL